MKLLKNSLKLNFAILLDTLSYRLWSATHSSYMALRYMKMYKKEAKIVNFEPKMMFCFFKSKFTFSPFFTAFCHFLNQNVNFSAFWSSWNNIWSLKLIFPFFEHFSIFFEPENYPSLGILHLTLFSACLL